MAGDHMFRSYVYRLVIALTCMLSVTVLPVLYSAAVKSDFVNLPLQFRPRPLWLWDDAGVSAAEVEAQLQGNRDKSGHGGLAPLPFGEKSSPKYLSEEYFAVYGATVTKARQQILATASSEWRECGAYEAAKAIDGSPDTRWALPDEETKDWWLEADFGADRTFNSTLIKEALVRVTSYGIRCWSGGAWATCVTGITIGVSKVDRFDSVTASRIRLAIGSVGPSYRPLFHPWISALGRGRSAGHENRADTGPGAVPVHRRKLAGRTEKPILLAVSAVKRRTP